MGADNYYWGMRGRGEIEEEERLRADHKRLTERCARAEQRAHHLEDAIAQVHSRILHPRPPTADQIAEMLRAALADAPVLASTTTEGSDG